MARTNNATWNLINASGSLDSAIDLITIVQEEPAMLVQNAETILDVELEAALTDWEAEEQITIPDFSEPTDPVTAIETAAGAEQVASFDDLVAKIPDETADALVMALAREIDERSAFETAKDPDNLNIQRTLKKVRSQLVTKRAARFSHAANVPTSFINRSIHGGSCYNVYALGKYADLVNFSVTGQVMNAINNACLRSLFRVIDAGKVFTMETAKMACSTNYTAKDGTDVARSHLVRHTVAPSTAPTQASSTMQALVTIGVVRAVGSTKNPRYELTANPITAKFRELLAA